MLPSPIFANLWNYRRRKAWHPWHSAQLTGLDSRTPSGSSTGSAEALLMLLILSRHDLARGPLATEGSRGSSPWGDSAAPARPLRDLSAPRCPLRELPPPGPAPAQCARRHPGPGHGDGGGAQSRSGPGLRAGLGVSRAAGRAGARIGLPRPPGWVSELLRALLGTPVPWRCPRHVPWAVFQYTSVLNASWCSNVPFLKLPERVLATGKKKKKCICDFSEGLILSGTCLAWWVLARAQVPIPYRCRTAELCLYRG